MTTDRSESPSAHHLPRRLEPFVAKASLDPRFAALVTGGAAPADRGYVIACLRLAGIERRPEDERRRLYREMVTRSRRAVLEELSNTPVPSAALKALGRCDWGRFTASDWRTLLCHVATDRGRRALGHLPWLTACLVRQLDAVPPPMLLPNVLTAVARIPLSVERWRELGAALEALGDERRPALLRQARKIRSYCDLRDFGLRTADAALEAAPFPSDVPRLDPLLRLLDGAEAMRREAAVMSNCLAERVARVLVGGTAYYRWLGAEPATVELVRRDGVWRISEAKGTANAALSSSTQQKIRGAVGRALGPESLVNPPPPPPPIGPGIAAAMEIGRTRFSDQERATITGVLIRIRGRSRAIDNGAFCIIDKGPFFVQFLSRVTAPSFLTEISSHRFQPTFAERVTEKGIDFLDGCGFSWPRENANFAFDLPGATDEDCAAAASFALGALAVLFGHRAGGRSQIKLHVPD